MSREENSFGTVSMGNEGQGVGSKGEIFTGLQCSRDLLCSLPGVYTSLRRPRVIQRRILIQHAMPNRFVYEFLIVRPRMTTDE